MGAKVTNAKLSIAILSPTDSGPLDGVKFELRPGSRLVAILSLGYFNRSTFVEAGPTSKTQSDWIACYACTEAQSIPSGYGLCFLTRSTSASDITTGLDSLTPQVQQRRFRQASCSRGGVIQATCNYLKSCNKKKFLQKSTFKQY